MDTILKCNGLIKKKKLETSKWNILSEFNMYISLGISFYFLFFFFIIV